MKPAIIVFMLLTVMATVAGCKKAGAPEAKTLPVKVQRVVPGPIESTMTVMGTVDSKIHAWVQSTAEGTVESLTVAEGRYVREGQILCHVMPPDSRNMFGQARAEYENVKREYGSKSDEISVGKMREAEKDFALAKNLFKPVPIVSPVNGTVISKNIENGTTVGVKQPLIEIADMNRLIIKTAVSEDMVAKLRQGQKAKIKLYARAESAMVGTIAVIAPGINFQTRTATVELTIPQKSDIKPGMTCAVEFVTASRDDAMAIPLEAVLTDVQGRKRVFVVKDEKAVARSIVTGIENNTQVEVLSGIQLGDDLVVLGHENLKDGVRVKITNGGKQAAQPGTQK